MEAILRSVNDPSDLANVAHDNLPYRFDQIFSAEGFGAKRLAKRRLKLMKAIDERIRSFLTEGETVDFVTWGVDYSFAEHYFMGIWAQLMNRRAVILTNRRILLIQINSRNKVLQLKSQIRYTAITKLSKSMLGHVGLVLRDKKKICLTGIPGKDRKQLNDRIAARMEAMRAEAPAPGLEHLCPHCGHRVVGLPVRCSKCARDFKSGARAGWLSLAWPGLGDLYLGHRALGVIEMIGAAAAWVFVMLALGFGLGESGDALAFDVTGAIVAGVLVFCFVHIPDGWITRRMGFKGIYPAVKDD
jgi:hypothetical protein